MQKYSDVVLDKNGKGVAGAVITVITYPAGLAATIYAADGGPAVTSVTTDQNGRFSFYAVTGHYSFTVSGTGITPITYNDVTIFDPNELKASGGSSMVGFGKRTVTDKFGEIASIGDYNAIANGTDETTIFTDAFTNAALGDRLLLSPKTYLVKDAFNKRVEINGGKGTTLQAAAGATRIMSLGRHAPDWNYHGVSGLTFDGNSKAAYCIDFNDSDVTAPEYGGRWVFERVSFVNATTGVYAKTGNIGNTYRNCHFRSNDYGLRLTTEGSAGKMHAGCSIIDIAEISYNAKAGVYINDAVDGGGQYDLNNVILEANPGYGLWANFNNITPYVPPVARNLWEEKNASATTVSVDGINSTPRAIFLQNIRPFIFDGTYLKDVKLVNSTVLARTCRIDGAAVGGLKLDLDSTSQLIVENMYANGAQSGIPYVRSILSQAGSDATTNYSLRGPLRSWRTNPNATVLLKQNYDGAGPWAFSGTATVNATSVADGVISATCAELVIPTGYSLLNAATFTPTVGKWVVWGCHLKLQAGAALATAAFSYNSKLGDIYQGAIGDWVCTYGIQYIGSTFSTVSTYFTNSSGASTTIRLADVFAIQFDTMEAAYAFANSGSAVR